MLAKVLVLNPNAAAMVIGMPPNKKKPMIVVKIFLICPVMDVVSGELTIEQRKMK
jgi:hypothetical protein